MTERIRVLRVIARMNIGGPAWQVKVLADALDPSRFEQHVVYGDLAPGEQDFFSLPGSRLPDHVEAEHLSGFGRSIHPLDDLKTLRSIRKRIKAFRPHIVHTHTAKAGTLGRIATLPNKQIASIHSFHGHVLKGYFSRIGTLGATAVERLLARTTDMYFAEGSVVRDELQQMGIGKKHEWKVVVPGLSPSPPHDRAQARASFGVPANAQVVGFVGRMTHIKRPDRLADVFRRVRAEIPNAHLLVAGDGDQMDAFKTALGEDHVAATLLGFTGRVPEVLVASDVVLLTSDNEGMPYTLIEAQMAGRPVVTTDAGSVRDVVVDGVTGRICGPDPATLALAVVELLEDADLWTRCSKAAAEWSQRQFSPARLAAEVADAYEHVVATRLGRLES